MTKNLRVALIHDWLVNYRGGEKVLEALTELYPNAPIFTLFFDRKHLPASFQNKKIIVPRFLNSFKFSRKIFLPFYPLFIESFDLSEFDFILSSSFCVAKGIIPPPYAKHLCYIHSPMRYIWDQRFQYMNFTSKISAFHFFYEFFAKGLRNWDVISSTRTDQFICNSSFVKKRVEKYYRRESKVIPPPVDVEKFLDNHEKVQKEDFFLTAGAFVKYKRFDLVIEACEKAGRNLVVAGSGPQEGYLKKIAKSKTKFVISPSDKTFKQLLQKARAIIYPGIEDFGIVAIEALACGTPVLGIQQGGCLDYIIPDITGNWIFEQTVDSVIDAIKTFEEGDFDPLKMQNFAKQYSKENFKRRIQEEIEILLGDTQR